MVTIIYTCGSFLSFFGVILMWMGNKRNNNKVSFIQEVAMIAVSIGVGITFFFNIVTSVIGLII